VQRKLQEIAASIRARPYLTERMFPQLRQRFGPALDLLVEFSTLGEYRLDANGVLCPASALALASEHAPQLGGAGDPVAARAAVRRIVAGGAVGLTPAATPAARRAVASSGGPACRGERPHVRAEQRHVHAERRHVHAERTAPRAKPRPRVPAAPEQLCLAV
jgi:hypothetical protein